MPMVRNLLNNPGTKFQTVLTAFFSLAPSFVPSKHTVSPLIPKNVRALYGSQSTSRRTSNDITMMPIGVPKVAYRVPGSQSADW